MTGKRMVIECDKVSLNAIRDNLMNDMPNDEYGNGVLDMYNETKKAIFQKIGEKKND